MRVFTCPVADGVVGTPTLEERAPPGLVGHGQIRIAMRAASLNYRDLLLMSGALALPAGELIPCSDGAGEVVETGSGVWRVKVGDRVALTFNPEWIAGPWRPSPGAGGRGGVIPGVVQDEIVVGQEEVVVLPASVSFEEGATLPCAAVTAWHALCAAAPLIPGMTVLLQGGGGVSLFALQFAKLFGARVIMTSSSAERCAKLVGLGADETVNYKADPEWQTAVRGLTGGMGVDLTLEMGGAKTIDQSLAATRAGGRIALVGLLTGRPQPASLFGAGVDITTIKTGSRTDFEAMLRAMEFHRVRPVIDSRYRFEDLPAAFAALKSGSHMGKIVIEF